MTEPIVAIPVATVVTPIVVTIVVTIAVTIAVAIVVATIVTPLVAIAVAIVGLRRRDDAADERERKSRSLPNRPDEPALGCTIGRDA